MPLYEYCCPSCGERFTLLRRLNEAGANDVYCVACGEPAARKFSTFATPGLRRTRSRVVRDDRMQSLLPYFAPRD